MISETALNLLADAAELRAEELRDEIIPNEPYGPCADRDEYIEELAALRQALTQAKRFEIDWGNTRPAMHDERKEFARAGVANHV